MEQGEKVKALVAHILEECEKEGLTITEAMRVPQALRFELEDRIKSIHNTVKITGSQTLQ